jgi:hypothetical protein
VKREGLKVSKKVVLLITISGLSAVTQSTQAPGGGRGRGGGFAQPEPIDFGDHADWTQIFDGKTLAKRCKVGTAVQTSGEWKTAQLSASPEPRNR